MAQTIQAISARQLNEAERQVQYLKNKIMCAYNDGAIRAWADIETSYGITLAELFPPNTPVNEALRNSKPIGYQLEHFLSVYHKNTKSRIERALEAEADDLGKLRFKQTPAAECYRFANPLKPGMRLFPEQDPVFRHLYNVLFNNVNLEPSQPQPDALLQNGKTGSGKTVVADSMIDKFIAEGKHLPDKTFPFPLPYPVLWITVANAVEQTKRSLEDAGLGGYLDKVIHVISWSDLTTSLGLIRFVERIEEPDLFNPALPPKVTFKWRLSAIPKFVILDEAHSIQNEDATRTQVIKALYEASKSLLNPLTNKPLIDTKYLFLTATPVEKVNDLRMFVCMTNLNFQGTRITFENFNTLFANVIALGQPNKVTKESTKRLWKVLRHRVVELPKAKWDHKAINMVKLYTFETDEDRNFYAASWERHLERCRMLGKDGDAGAEYTSLMIFARDVEPIRARQIVREMHGNVQTGGTSVMAVRFVDTIIKAVFTLMDEFGVPADQIAVIYGGRRNIQPERIITEEDMVELFRCSQENGGLSREQKKLIELNLAWQKDRLLFADKTPEAQAARYERMKALGLVGIQTKERRQKEIDKFQTGKAPYCFFTADSGGTGLSFEHADNRTAQRTLWATPIYNGKQFVQVMGRCPRRVSISDSIQYICLMDGTIESQHVAPILDNKLQSAGEFTSSRDDIAMALAGKKLRATEFKRLNELGAALRSRAQAEADAADERSQITSDSSADDDSDDDNTTVTTTTE